MNLGNPIGRLWMIGALALVTPVISLLAQDLQTVPETCADGSFKVLLIGNRAYRKLPPVETAINDLNSIKSALQAVLIKNPPFTTLEDVQDISELKTKIDKFTAEVRPGDVVLFYYTGHAIQYEDDDFLLPLDFDPQEDPESITSTAYSVSSRLIARLKNASARVVILDAGRQWNGPGGILGLRGLTASSERTAIFFSTAADATMPLTRPGSATSEFARQFIAAIRDPGLNISQLFEKIGNLVRTATGGLQQPFSASSAGLSDCRLLKAPPPPPKTNVPQTNPRDHLEYVYIPAGNFIMGCVDKKDTRCKPEEKPAHHVNISRGFWVGVNEVTVTEYLRYVKIAKAARPGPPLKNPGWEHGDFPIVNVAWSDADKFCKWAGGRLPTEAEWEYAARGGSATIYPWGDEITHEDAKFNAVIRGNKTGADIYEEMAPVRQYRKNGWGLYDVVGNVWEWVNDWYKAPYDPDPDNPRVAQAGDKKAVRGGSYHDSDNGVRLSVRKSASPKDVSNEVGFRCVIDNWPN